MLGDTVKDQQELAFNIFLGGLFNNLDKLLINKPKKTNKQQQQNKKKNNTKKHV